MKKPINTIFMLVSTLCLHVSAAELNWSTSPYSLYARQDSLRDILVDIASNEGVAVEVHELVDDVISVTFENRNRKEVFHELVEAYGLIWYYDGHRLYIDRVDNTAAETIKLNTISPEAFKRHLEKLGVIDNDNRFYWRAINQKGLIYISGPEPFVERVRDMSVLLDTRRARPSTTIYKWKDKKGITNYSSDPPAASGKSTVIEIENHHPIFIESSDSNTQEKEIYPNKALIEPAENPQKIKGFSQTTNYHNR